MFIPLPDDRRFYLDAATFLLWVVLGLFVLCAWVIKR